MHDAGPFSTVHAGRGPFVAAAIHAGHELRPELHDLITLSESEGLLEEDPLTDAWTEIAPGKTTPTRGGCWLMASSVDARCRRRGAPMVGWDDPVT